MINNARAISMPARMLRITLFPRPSWANSLRTRTLYSLRVPHATAPIARLVLPILSRTPHRCQRPDGSMNAGSSIARVPRRVMHVFWHPYRPFHRQNRASRS